MSLIYVLNYSLSILFTIKDDDLPSVLLDLKLSVLFLYTHTLMLSILNRIGI